MTDVRLAQLMERVPALRVLTEDADLTHYGRDWTRRWAPAPLAIALPASVAEVQAVVRWANEAGVALVPSGGRTGLSGGAVAANGELVLSLGRMNRILDFDAVGRLLRVEPGVTLEAAHVAAREHGLLYPVDLGSRGSCTIGGNIATNAGGIRVIRHGSTRQWVAGLKVVTGAGELLDLNRGLVKNASGYDFRQLLVGSEGTLGIVVEAELRLTDPLPRSQVMLLGVPGLDALMRVFALYRERLTLQAFEFFSDRALAHVVARGGQRPLDGDHPYYIVTEFDAADEAQRQAGLAAFARAQEQGWVGDGVAAQSEAQARALWRLREGITESIAPLQPYKSDVSVRISRMPAFIAEVHALLSHAYPDNEVVWFGHIGDGNLHINVLPPPGGSIEAFNARCDGITALLADAIARHGGSISAEHGVGLVKRDYLGSTRSAAGIALMQGVRRVFDPRGILNPGKLLVRS